MVNQTKAFFLMHREWFITCLKTEAGLCLDTIMENPSLKDIGYVLGVQPFDCTPFYNASLDFADKTVKNFNFLFSGAIFMLDSFVNENLFNQSI